MTIGDKAITKSDVVNEIKIILILNNESYSDEKRDDLHNAAVKSIIMRNIKKIEVERHKFRSFNQLDLEKELMRLASGINMDLDTLKSVCASNDLNFSLIEDQVKIELFWNSLIFEFYKNKLTVDSNEISDQLKSFQSKKEEEYLISEILIKPVEESQLESEIKKIKDQINTEGFENVAKNLSISNSSSSGGNLGWLNENSISSKIKSSIINTPLGEISKPILLREGILIFKVRDKRIAEKELNLEEAKNKLVNIEKQKILNMYSRSHYDKLKRSISIKFLQ